MRHETLRSLALCLATTWAPAAGLAADDPPDLCSGNAARVEMIVHGSESDDFWQKVRRGVRDAETAVGLQVCLRFRPDIAMMMVAIEETIEAPTTTGLIATIPTVPISKLIKSAHDKKKIPVVTINSGADLAGPILHVGQNERQAGCLLGAALNGLTAPQASAGGATKHSGHAQDNRSERGRRTDSSAVCIVHEQNNNALEQRCDGLAVGLGGRVRVLSTSQDDWLDKLAELTTGGDPDSRVNVVVALGPDSSHEILNRMKIVGRDKVLGSAKFGVFDRTEEVDAVEGADKINNVVVDQQPYLQGYLSVVFVSLKNAVPIRMVESGPKFRDGVRFGDENICRDRPSP
ncbi:substrate-binding domain-containing protein [Ensifer adhaerens]|uniref:Substrate-binding domain-containing protein n=1 Tax=Ensifer adhaerens TaxID=106592 RepID=A0A9Q8YG37_ENSAD|nr:substrate-binding domain-containing protein [Ensifer adhaerens]USJ27561.1 substrate-binding domain-containing protein [Ensifer adhaerens]